MKNFNFFEKLWEHSRTLRRVGLVLVMCLISITHAWAWIEISSANVYYDNSSSNWDESKNVVIAIERLENWANVDNHGCGVFAMGRIANTKLWRWAGSFGYNDINGYRFGSGATTYNWYAWWYNSETGQGETTSYGLAGRDNWANVSGFYQESMGNVTKIFGAISSDRAANLSKKDISTFPGDMNYTQNVYYSVCEGAGSYTKLTTGTTPAKIQMSSYKFVSEVYDAVSSETPDDIAAGGTTRSRSFTAGHTATTQITVSNIVDGYEFMGWYDAASDGTQLEDAEHLTYTYYPKSACDVYARFRKISYSLAGENWNTAGINWAAGTVASGGTRLMTTTDGITYSTTMTGETLGGSTRLFKLIKNQAWDANAIAANTDGVTKICYNGTLEDGGEPNHNFTLTPYLAGAITVSYNTSTTTLTVTCEEPIITFSKDGGDGGTSSQKTYSTKITSSVEKPSKTGYNFAGYWSDDATPVQVIDANGAWMRNVSGYTDNNSPCKWSTSLNSNHTFTAHWTAKTYNIDLDRQQGSSGSTSVTMTYNSASHTAITAPTAPTGYTFAGWYTGALGTGSMVMNASGVLQANVDGYTGDGGVWTKDATCTLYAKYTATNYPDGYLYITDVKSVPETKAGTTITATLSGATYNASLNGSFAHSGLQYWALVGNSSDTYTLTFSSALTASATAAGVAVDVWWGANGTSSNSGTTVYLNGTSSGNKIGEAAANGDTRNQLLETLKNVRAVGTTSVTSLQLKRYNANGAAWFRVGIKEIPGYKLTYDDGDGTGAPSASYQPNATIKLSSTIPTYAGHLFAGWQVDGSGTVYAPGDDFDMPAEATTLVAKWEEICFTGSITKSSSSYTVNSGATKDITSDASVTSGGAITIVNNSNGNISYAFSSDGMNINTTSGYIVFSLPTGSTLTTGSIIRVQGKGSSASTGLKIIDDSGNTLKSQSASTIDFTYTVTAESAINGNSYVRINRASDNGVKLKSVTIAGCGSVSCYTPAEPTISGTASYIVGETIELTADITGSNHDSNTEYTWYKGADWATASAADPVQAAAKAASNGHIFTKTAAVGDAGTYWCLASNDDDCEAHNETGKAITVVYQVTYDKNGGTGDAMAASTGTSITLSSNGYTAPSGYTFDGWRTVADKNASGTDYAAGTSSITQNLSLYAMWKQTVKLDANGGSDDGSLTAYYNASGPFTPSAPSYSDHTLVDGYYAESGCTNKVMALDGTLQTSVTDGSSVNWTDASSKWIHNSASTLYAKWKCNTPTISFNAQTKTVSISGITDATVYYTTDGSDPDNTSTSYTAAFTIDAEKTIKAIAIQTGCTSSGIASKTCTPCGSSGLEYAITSVTKTYGAANATNSLTNPNSLSVTYSTSNSTVADVNESTGEVTFGNAGTARITATWAGSDTYCADAVYYDVTVNKADISPVLTYDPTTLIRGVNSPAPTVTENPGSGSVTYTISTSSPADIATVNTSTGVVSSTGTGTITVTATVAATTNYNSGTATFDLTIRAPYTVYFRAGDGTVTPTSATESSYDGVSLPTPTYASHTFLGWYNGVTNVGKTGKFIPTEDGIYLYAGWKETCSGGPLYSMYLTAYNAISQTTADVSSITKTLASDDPTVVGGNNYYKFNSSTEITLTYDFIAGDVIHFVLSANQSNKPGGVYVTEGETSTDVTTTLDSSRSDTLEYEVEETGTHAISFTREAASKGNMRFHGLYITRAGGGGTCYYVTYNGNGATSGYTSDPTAYSAGDPVNAAYHSDFFGFKRTGYDFVEWNTAADGSGTAYKPSARITNSISSDITLYAQWGIVISSDNTNFVGKDTPSQYKDVRVTNGATLTLTQTTTVRNITVETGSTLNVSTNSGSAITLATNSLSLVGGWNDNKTKYDMPRVYINPASKITREEKDINFDIAVDNSNYYPIAVPFDVSMSDVTYKNPTLASAAADRYGTIYAVKTYNGANRANGTSPTWSLVGKDKTLKPGHGYILCAVPARAWEETTAVIRFPMKNVPDAALAAGELGSYSTTIKDTVKITAYRQDGDTDGKKTPPSNTGWNLIAVPYMSCYTTSADMTSGSYVEEPATIITGRINFDNGKWVDDGIQYVTVPKYDFSEYIQAKITDDDTITTLLPGWCFFVQVAETGNLRFLSASEAASGSWPIYAPKREQEYKPTLNTGIILTGNGAKDKTNFLISDKYSAAEYEINADLEKMFGENSFTLATYSLSGETRLAYNAMSNADAANIIPIGYRAPADGEYTFSINPRYAENGAFEHVNLIDYETGIMTDLLMGSYTFSTERTQLDTRFALNVVPRKDTPTDIENGASGINDANGPRKVLINDKMYIIVDGKMYDATGKAVK